MTAGEGDAVLLRSTKYATYCNGIPVKHSILFRIERGTRWWRFHIATTHTYAAMRRKAKKCHFLRKFDLWPDLTRSNIDLRPKTICAIARSRRDASTVFFSAKLYDHQGPIARGVVPTPPDRPRYEKCPDLVFFREALRPSGPGGVVPTPPPPDRPRNEKCPDRARVNPITMKLLMLIVNENWPVAGRKRFLKR